MFCVSSMKLLKWREELSNILTELSSIVLLWGTLLR